MQIIPDYTGSSFAVGVWRLLQALWDVLCEKIQAVVSKIFHKNSIEIQQAAPSLQDRVVQISPTAASAIADPVLELASSQAPVAPELSASSSLPEASLPAPAAQMVCAIEVADAEASSSQSDNSLLGNAVYVAQKGIAFAKFLASNGAGGLAYMGRMAGLFSLPIESVPHQEESQQGSSPACVVVASASPLEEELQQEPQAQVLPVPEAIAVSAEPSLNFDSISKEQEAAFGELLPTLYAHLGTFKQIGLAPKKSRLESLGDSLKPLHPLVYLGYVLRRLGKEFAEIFEHSCTVGEQFREKTIQALNANKDKIIPHIEEFAQTIGKPNLSKHLQDHAQQSKWQDFIRLCIL